MGFTIPSGWSKFIHNALMAWRSRVTGLSVRRDRAALGLPFNPEPGELGFSHAWRSHG